MAPTRRTGPPGPRSVDRPATDDRHQPTAHARGVADSIGRFWRDYEIRNAGPTVEERVAELERTVADLEGLVATLVVTVNQMVARVNTIATVST
jgi:hypothetical protein